MSSPAEQVRGAKSGRPEVSADHIEAAYDQLLAKGQYRLEQKGPGGYASRHEILGILQEEMHELTGAVHEHALSGRPEDLERTMKYWVNRQHFQQAHPGKEPPTVEDELIDIAWACLFGVACIKAGALGW